MMEIETSVVLATYNGEAFLQKQLASIVAQSVAPSELVIIDDASTDSTPDIVKSFAEKYGSQYQITTVFRDRNIGYISNFIDGMALARGRVIVLCDQDDVWKPNRIEFALEFFREHPDCVALHSDCDLIDRTGATLARGIQGYKRSAARVHLKDFVKKVNYPGMALAFLREEIVPLLQEISSSGTPLPTHDWLIAYLACKHQGLYLTNTVLTERRDTGVNVALAVESRRLTTIERRIDGVLLYKQYYQLMESLGESDLRVDRYLAVADSRIEYLRACSKRGLLGNLGKFRYYPSLKALIGDSLLVVRGGVQ